MSFDTPFDDLVRALAEHGMSERQIARKLEATGTQVADVLRPDRRKRGRHDTG